MPRKPTPIAMAEPAPDYRSFSHPPRAERPQAQRAPRQVGRLPDPIPTSPILPVDRVGREPVTLPYMRQPKEIPTVTPIYQDLFGKQPKGLLCDPTPLYPGPWSSCDPGGGGNIHSLLLHPTCANTFFVGPDNGTLARGIYKPTGGTTFENFQKGILGRDVVALTMSPTGADDQFYSVCGSLVPPTAQNGVPWLFRFNPDTKEWVNLPLLKWALPGTSILSTMYKPQLLEVVHLGKGLHVLVAVTKAVNFPVAFGGAGKGTIATGGSLRASTVCVGVPGPSFDSMTWYGMPYKAAPASEGQGTSAPWKVDDHKDPVTVHPCGIGSLWVAPQVDDASITAYMTVAFETPDITNVRYTELVECRIELHPPPGPVKGIQFRVLARSWTPGSQDDPDTPYTGPQYVGALDLSESYQTWAKTPAGNGPVPFEMVQVAGLPSANGGLRLWITTSVRQDSNIKTDKLFADFPRVICVTLRGGSKSAVNWASPRNLSVWSVHANGNLDSEAFLKNTKMRMTWCRASGAGRIYAAPGSDSSPSLGLWRWDENSSRWERLTFYYGWQSYGGMACYSATPKTGGMDKTWFESWFDAFADAYTSAGLDTVTSPTAALHNPDLCPKILMAVGTRANWPQSAARTPYSLPVPNIAVFFNVLDALGKAVSTTEKDRSGGDKKVDWVSCSFHESGEVLPNQQNLQGSILGINAMPMGEVDPDGFRWTIVPIPIGAIWGAVLETLKDASSKPHSLTLELRVRSSTSGAKSEHRIRLLPLLPKKDVSLGEWAGAILEPWNWTDDDLLVVKSLSASSYKSAKLFQTDEADLEAPGTFDTQLSIAIDTQSSNGGPVAASVNFDQLATWDYRRARAGDFFNALAVAPHPSRPAVDRIVFAAQGDSTVYGSWDDGASFRPFGSTVAKSAPYHSDTLWRSKGLGTVWVLDFHFAGIRGAGGEWKSWYFVATEDGGVFGGPYDDDDDGPPALMDLNWNIPEYRALPTPEGLGPPTVLSSTVQITYSVTHRFVPNGKGELQAEILASLALRSGTFGGRVLRGAPIESAAAATGGQPGSSSGPTQRLSFDDRTLTGLPDAAVITMVTTAGTRPGPGSQQAQGTVFAAAIGAGVFALPPGSNEWKRVGAFVTRIQDPTSGAWEETTLVRDPFQPEQNSLLNIFHLALCGGTGGPRVLYASINVLSASRIDSGYSLTPDELVVLYDDLFRSHSAAGLYRLEWATDGKTGIPVNVDEEEPWDQPDGAVVFRHVAGLGAANELATAGGPFGASSAVDLNFPQAWRNITSISGTRSGHLVVTTRSMRAVHPGIPLSFDGGVFACNAATQPQTSPLKADPKFELLFTHPWAGSSAFYDLGEERLFVALDVYGELETDRDPKNKSATPFAQEVAVVPAIDAGRENRNQYYFTDGSPEVPRWPIGVFEVKGWKSASLLTLDEIHNPPQSSRSCSKPSDQVEKSAVKLVGLNDNLCSVAQEWLRLEVGGGRLLAGGRGSGGFWRKLLL